MMDLSAAASLRSITSAKFRVSVAAALIRACAVLGSWSSRPLRASAGSASGSAPTPAYSARNLVTSSMPVRPASRVTISVAGAGSAVALGPVSTSALAGLGLTSAVGGAVSVLGLFALAPLGVAASPVCRVGVEAVASGVGVAGGLSRMITAGGALGVGVRMVVVGVVEVVGAGAVFLGGSAWAFFARSALAVSAAEARLLRPSPAAETEEAAGRTGTAGMAPAAPRVRASLQETNKKDYTKKN